MTLSAISIRQPWPYAIFRLGKDFENRSWRLPPQYIGVPVLIHAGKQVDKPGLEYLEREAGFTIPADLPLGGIVGFAVFTVQCGRWRTSDWAAQGMYNWPIVASGKLPFHPCKGSLGFFKVSYPHPAYADLSDAPMREMPPTFKEDIHNAHFSHTSPRLRSLRGALPVSCKITWRNRVLRENDPPSILENS